MLAWFLVAPLQGAIEGEVAPDGVDLRLKFAAATMNHRLLVYEACTDGRCASTAYLQWFKTEWSSDPAAASAAPVRKILATCDIVELTGDLLVHRAWWVTGSGADPVLHVAASPPAVATPQHEVRLTPDRPCEYRLETSELD